MEEKLIGQAEPKQIEAWKKKYGKLFGIKVDGHICYLKKPDRKILSFASVSGTKNPLKFNEVLLNNCWLGGSDEIKTDDDLFLAASGKIAEMITIKEAELVNF